MDYDCNLTVLDRLLLELGQEREAGRPARDALGTSLTRNLEMLLNSRLPSALVPPEFPECATSILNFGVPEFDTFGNLGNAAEQQKLCAAFAQAIAGFEPRLEDIRVRLLSARERDNLLRLQIEGTLASNGEMRRFEAGVKPYAGFVTISPGGGA